MDLLGRAKKMLKAGMGSEPTGPQYYHVACPEGHVIRGLRTEGYQAIRCPTCGEGIFVLPRSPLPDPPAPSTLQPRRRRAAPAPVEDAPIELSEAPPQNEAEDVIWLDPDPAESAEVVAAERVVRGRPTEEEIPEEYRSPPAAIEPLRNEATAGRPVAPAARTRPAARQRPAPEREPATRPRRSRPEPEELLEPSRSRRPSSGGLLAWAARHRLGVVLTGVALLVGITVGYRIWLQRWEKLPQIAEKNWNEGQEALELGHFDEAKQKLAIAASAFERLGIQDERTTRSRQLADEAAILADRCRLKLDELIEEAARFTPAEGWPDHFATIYKGQSVIFDTTIVATPEGSRSGAYEIDYRIFAGRGPVPTRQGHIDLRGFRLFETLAPRVGETKIFGGRLDTVTFANGEWAVHLEPESGVLMTEFQALEQTDWVPSETASSARDENQDSGDARP